MGLGLALLANSRPLEGLVAVLPAAVLVAVRTLGKNRPPLRESMRFLLLPLGAVLLATAGWMAYYNYRVTDEPFRTPYQVWLDTYQSPTAVYRHQALSDYRGSPPVNLEYKLRRLRAFYFPFPLLIPLFMLPWMLKSSKTWLALVVCGLVVGVSVTVSRAWAHYVAPMTGLVFALVVQGLARIYHLRWRGMSLTRSLVWITVFLHMSSFVVLYARQQRALWFQNWQVARARILEMLESDERYHLVLVRYRPGHDVHREWVFNEADINGAKVIWAREMEPERNRELVDYFTYRRIWLLEADANPPRLQPYPIPPP